MALRLVCLFLCFVVPGWWVLIPVIGVIVLPAIAVMLANVTHAPGVKKATAHTNNRPSLTSGLQ
ncbi:MAG: hypothetical protein RLZ72_1126 [Actinomycetota bacterium]|jgi:ABC-type protease/lipase transport system fused ATPase/permease subunit